MNADKQGQALRSMWEEFDQPVGVGLDASRFDQHVSVAALRVEHSQWLTMVPVGNRAWLKELLQYQIINQGRAVFPSEGKQLKYTV